MCELRDELRKEPGAYVVVKGGPTWRGRLIHGELTSEEERARDTETVMCMITCKRPSKKEFTALKDVLKRLIPELDS